MVHLGQRGMTGWSVDRVECPPMTEADETAAQYSTPQLLSTFFSRFSHVQQPYRTDGIERGERR